MSDRRGRIVHRRERVASPVAEETATPSGPAETTVGGPQRPKSIEQLAPTGAVFEVRQDRTTAVMTGFFGLLAAAILVFLHVGTFAKLETVRGHVTTASGLTRVLTPRPGVVVSVAVPEGSFVTAGSVLLTIEPVQLSSAGDRTTDMERRGLEERAAALAGEIRRIDEVLVILSGEKFKTMAAAVDTLEALRRQEADLRSSLASEEDQVQKLRDLIKRGYVTRDRLDGYVRTARELKRQLTEVTVKRGDVERNRSDRMATIDTEMTTKTSQRAQFKNELADLQAKLQLNRANRRIDIIAPRAGRVAALTAAVGSTLTEGQFVAAIAEPGQDDRVIRLSAPSSAIGLVEPGQRVVLKYDAFPFKSFGIQRGTILSISEAPRDDPDALAASALPTPGGTGSPGAMEARFAPRQTSFLILVRPDASIIRAYGVERPIQLGSTLSADIVVERRRLIDWVIDPILAMQGRT